jgi:hypothetical protein
MTTTTLGDTLEASFNYQRQINAEIFDTTRMLGKQIEKTNANMTKLTILIVASLIINVLNAPYTITLIRALMSII